MMARTFNSGPDDLRLVQYLLGLLPEDEAEELDEVSVADDAFASRLRSVEDDLVDGYVRGTLEPTVRERFEAYYLASPRRRERVRFAESFVPAVDGAASAGMTSGAAESPSSTAPFKHAALVAPSDQATTRPLASRTSGWNAWLLAAAVLLLAVSGGLILNTVRLQRRLNTARDERTALDRRAHELEQQLTDQRAALTAAQDEAARGREAITASAPVAPSPGSTDRSRPTLSLALLLLPQTRSIAAIPTVAIPPGTERVAFQLQLESNDHSSYQVALQDPGTKQILWRSNWMEPNRSAGQSSVAVAVPTRLLNTQHYSLDLAGRRASGDAEVVGSYAVQIVPR